MNSSLLTCSVLLGLLFWTSFRSSAQGPERERQYTQQREAAARAADERAHIQSAYTNNLPNGYGSSSGSSSGYIGPATDPVRDMVEGWRAAGRERSRRDSLEADRLYGPYVREVARQAAAEKARLEESARGIQNMNAEIARRTAGYRQQMDAEGFAPGSDELGAFMHDLSAVMPGGISSRHTET